MEPNNIENQIREKLHSRKIQPSSKAWDRLDAMLSINEEKKTKRSFGWLYIAASILVFVSVGMYFYNQKETKINTTETVVSNEKTTDSVQQNNTTNAAAEKEIENTATSSETQSSNQTIKPKSLVGPITPEGKAIATNHKTNSNPIINTPGKAERSIIKEKEIEFQNSNDVALKNLPKILTPNKEIVVANPTINQDAMASVDVKKSETSSKVKVNANSLLSEVDGELELTFREKVFKKATKNYQQVKMALANRNQEQ